MLNKFMYELHPLRWLLWPFSIIYKFIVCLRKYYLQRFCCKYFDVPIIVVGNITMGGVGKTPFVIALAEQLTQKGLRVGIVSRGYGAQIKNFPYAIKVDDSAFLVGDEPLMLAQNTGLPVIIAPKRIQAVQYLLDNYNVNIVISDDGLQHYRMGRALEIALIDGERGLGNGLCLPAGPLRESVRRLTTVDVVVVNGNVAQMSVVPYAIKQLTTGDVVQACDLGESVAAVAGIGNPQRFFNTLEQLGIKFNAYPFADHYKFTKQSLNFSEKNIIMTEKDAVKCVDFAQDNMYFLAVKAQLSEELMMDLWKRITKCNIVV